MITSELMQSLMINGLEAIGLESSPASISYILASILILAIFAIIGLLTARFILYFKVVRLILRSRNTWDDALLESGVFRRVAHLIPGLVVYGTFERFFSSEHQLHTLINNLSVIYLIIATGLTLSALLTGIEKIYAASALAKKAPITGFIQVARLMLTIIVVFLIVSLLLDKSPIYLLSGLTALAAVLLLIFRDTILGFVAGIQIAANRMFNTGDWIEMPKFGVDGEITMIGLNVVKVQNWDKTISTIPTYLLISEVVKNWRGMSESGGRRIKRTIQIDIHSVRFADDQDLNNWKQFDLLSPYLSDKQIELKEDMLRRQLVENDTHNQRRLTNLGSFRAYLDSYIKNHPNINTELTCMIRQLKPTEVGIPIEIYCFSREKDWVKYEGIQADIFDHVFAVLPFFGLVAYERDGNMLKR